MNKRKLIYFLSAFVLIIGCYALNLSYSLFTQNISTGSMVDSNVPIINANLEQDTFTIPASGGKVAKLKIINSGNIDIQYGISINVLPANVNAYLVDKIDNDIVGNINGVTNKEVLVYLENQSEEDKTISFNLITKYQTLNFDIETHKINSKIDCENKVKLLNDNILTRAMDDTITDVNKTVYDDNFDSSTITEISGINERKLIKAEDDYGISYVFRGNVKDNYVEFNNMCWRIVRIEGDGSIKIILAAQKQCSQITDSDTDTAFIGRGDYGFNANYEIQSTLNMKSKLNIFLYGGSFESYGGAKTYTAWSTSALDMLKTTRGCLNSNAYTYEGVLMTESEKQNAINNWDGFYYDTYIRLNGIGQTAIATLRCNGEKTSETKILPITADEVVFAGGKIGTSNQNYYLVENAISGVGSWWTLSPAGFIRKNLYGIAFCVYSHGSLSDDYNVEISTVDLRPTVSLISSAIISSGDGTLENPYVVG